LYVGEIRRRSFLLCPFCSKFVDSTALQCPHAVKMASSSVAPRLGNRRSDTEVFLSGKHLGNKFHQLFDVRPGSTKPDLDK